MTRGGAGLSQAGLDMTGRGKGGSPGLASTFPLSKAASDKLDMEVGKHRKLAPVLFPKKKGHDPCPTVFLPETSPTEAPN